jgi:hypothetical protein
VIWTCTETTLGSVGLSVPIVNILPVCWVGCVPEEFPPQLDRANIASNEANTPIAFEMRIANLLLKRKIELRN